MQESKPNEIRGMAVGEVLNHKWEIPAMHVYYVK